MSARDERKKEIMMQGFARVAVAIPPCRVANAEENGREHVRLMQRAHDAGCGLVVFPELSLSAYTARDLFFDRHLLQSCEKALGSLLTSSSKLDPLFVVGLPVRDGSALYNAAAVFQAGKLLGVVPKSFLPNYREFEERRWFRPGTEVPFGSEVALAGDTVPFGTDLLFVARGQEDFVVGLELCEDYWVQHPPSMFQVSAGATVCANLSASNFTLGKADLRRLLAQSASDRGKCAYLYVAAGPGESSTDLAFDSDGFICENGHMLAQSKRFSRQAQLVSTDVDLEALIHERMVTGTFGDCGYEHGLPFRRLSFAASAQQDLKREVDPHPFIPKDEETLARRAWEIFEIQTNALLTRMEAIGEPTLVLGVSGGLDSTHAALVAAAALDLAERPRTDLLCVTMPGLGTSAGTQENAKSLAQSLGASFREIGISETSRLVLQQIDHGAGAETVDEVIEKLRADKTLGDNTVQNVQARMRTLLLMNLANQHHGLVVGTGDLSEKALGWSTYAGDHIAMYDVNAGVPKTLIQFVIRWVIRERIQTWTAGDHQLLAQTLAAILDTPISPELLPPDKEGRIAQLTEGEIGPYELHDFFLYRFVRHGARPARILDLAQVAFAERYTLSELKKWLRIFLKRFFSQQFKRSCTADGPKVGSVALSPRGDWRMPSDADVSIWLAEVDAYD